MDKQQHKLEDTRTDDDCCFNYIIGYPENDGSHSTCSQAAAITRLI
jgi:hypothetical protein